MDEANFTISGETIAVQNAEPARINKTLLTLPTC